MTERILADTTTGKMLPAPRISRRAAIVGAAAALIASPTAGRAPEPARRDHVLARLIQQLDALPLSLQAACAELAEALTGKSESILTPQALKMAQGMYTDLLQKGHPQSDPAMVRLDAAIVRTLRHHLERGDWEGDPAMLAAQSMIRKAGQA